MANFAHCSNTVYVCMYVCMYVYMLVVTYILVQLFAHTVTQWAYLGDPGRSGTPIMVLVRDS